MTKIENPPAFPQGNEWMDMEGNMRLAHEGGMALRDWFAGQAPEPPQTWWGGSAPDCAGYAMWNYQYADAMLAERAKGEGDE